VHAPQPKFSKQSRPQPREAGEKLILSRLEHSDLTPLYITQWLQLSDLRQLSCTFYRNEMRKRIKIQKASCELCPRLDASQRGT
jgi:hypothetical protein